MRWVKLEKRYPHISISRQIAQFEHDDLGDVRVWQASGTSDIVIETENNRWKLSVKAVVEDWANFNDFKIKKHEIKT